MVQYHGKRHTRGREGKLQQGHQWEATAGDLFNSRRWTRSPALSDFQVNLPPRMQALAARGTVATDMAGGGGGGGKRHHKHRASTILTAAILQAGKENWPSATFFPMADWHKRHT